NRWIREVKAGRAQIALLGNLARVRIDDIPGDASALWAAVGVERCIERAPQLAVRVHDLLHARVVRVRPRDDLGVRRLAAEQEVPAADTGDRCGGGVINAVALRRVRSRSAPRALLLLLRWEGIGVDAQHVVAQAQSR